MALHALARPEDLPAPPGHLSASSVAVWTAVVADYMLEAHQLELLAAALDARDRMIEARDLVLADGLTVTDSRGATKAHPAVVIERDSRLAMARLFRELALDVPGAEARPPRRGGQTW